MPLLTELEIWLGLVSTKMSRLRRWTAALLEPASWCCYASKRFMPLGLIVPPETPEQRAHRIEYINQRWKQLHGLEKECADTAIKYLLLTNSGGAVTVLSFMGASEKARTSTGAIVALALFVTGVVLVGVFNIIRYYKIASLFNQWKRDSEKYFDGNIAWKAMTDDDNYRSAKTVWLHIVGNLSFVAFVIGAIFGMINLFK